MIVVFALLTLVAALWLVVFFRRGGLIAGCLLVLAAGICLGPHFFHRSLGPVQISLDRLLWIALIAYYAVARLTGATVRRPLTRSDLLLGAFYSVVVASVVAFDYRHADSRPLSQLLFYHLLPLGIYWVARHAVYTERTVIGMLSGLAVFGVYLGITAIAETHGLSWLVYPRYIAAADNPEFFGRARGPLMNPAGAGILLGLCLGASVLLWPKTGRGGRMLLGVTAVLLLAGVYSTMTRTAWLGAGLGVVVIGGLAMPRQLRLPAVAACVLLAGLVGATQWESLLRFKRDKEQSAADTADSVKLRPILAVVALKMFADRPLTGCGFAHYNEAHNQYLEDRPWGLALEKAEPYIQHNILLSFLVELGLAGAGLFVIVLGLWLREACLIWHDRERPAWMRQFALLFLAFFANYFVNGMFHDVTLIPMVNMVLYFLAGALIAIRQDGERVAYAHRSESTRQSEWTHLVTFLRSRFSAASTKGSSSSRSMISRAASGENHSRWRHDSSQASSITVTFMRNMVQRSSTPHLR